MGEIGVAQAMKHKGEQHRFRNQDVPTIHRIPACVRGADSDDFDPRIFSIGPFHRGKRDCSQMEALKWRYLWDLIDRSPEHNKHEAYVDAVQALEERARRQYSVEIDLDSDDFVEMLVLDGCFVLEFLLKRAFGPVGSPFKEVKWNLPLLRVDLLLFENQIPFFVLQALFDKSDVPGLKSLSSPTLMGLALHYISRGKVVEEDLPAEKISEVHHLLHLSHMCQLNGFEHGQTPKAFLPGNYFAKFTKSLSGALVTASYFVLLLLLRWRPPDRSPPYKKGRKAPRSIPSATKLREFGIRFRKAEGDCLLNVSFAKDEGTIEIPFLSIQQSIGPSFRNLIAFEQCCPVTRNEFTTYAVLMDNLIQTSADVSVLVEAGIIETKLGSTEEVVQLFNGLCKGTCLGYDKHYLVGLFRDVRDHCESDRNRWRAELARGYFGNEWARIISTVAFALLLLLTAFVAVFGTRRCRNE